MSLHTIVHDGFAVLRQPRAVSPRPAPRLAVPVRISISSMRVLETGIALGALATALLIGQGR